MNRPRGLFDVTVEPSTAPSGEDGLAIVPQRYLSPYPDGLPGHARNRASTEAAAAIARGCTERQQAVAAALAEAGADGLTAQEVADRIGVANVYSVAPRITELGKLGIVVDSGRTRIVPPRCPHCSVILRTAKPATVWLLATVENGRAATPGSDAALQDGKEFGPMQRAEP